MVFIQLQMLLDCCDGEVARWRQTSSPKGVYLDRVGHYVAECGISVALGIRAAGELAAQQRLDQSRAAARTAGRLNKVENDLVHVARHYAGLPQMQDAETVRKPPRRGLLRTARRVARFIPFHRVFHSVELSLLILVAAVLDLWLDGVATQWLLIGLCRRRGDHAGRPPGRGAELAEAAMTGVVATRPRYGVVVLTMGKRRGDLQRGLESLLDQRDVDLDVVVVGNGWQPTGLPDGVRAHGLPDNLGIPAGRNAGVDLVDGDLLFFLDDDARLPTPTVLGRAGRRCSRADPTLGLIQPRVVDPDGRPAPRRWTPRLRVGDPARSSPAMSVWEGAVAMRREAFDVRRRLAGPVLVRPRGHRARLAGLGRRLARALRRRRSRSIHPAISPTRHAGVLPLPGPQPGLAGPAQPAAAGRSALRAVLGAGRRRPAADAGRRCGRPYGAISWGSPSSAGYAGR